MSLIFGSSVYEFRRTLTIRNEGTTSLEMHLKDLLGSSESSIVSVLLDITEKKITFDLYLGESLEQYNGFIIESSRRLDDNSPGLTTYTIDANLASILQNFKMIGMIESILECFSKKLRFFFINI